MFKIIVTFLVAGLLGFCTPRAHASITDLKLSTAQIFDVQWYTSGGKLYASSFNYIYSSVNYTTQTTQAARLTSANYADINSVSGRWIGFFNSTTNPGTYGMAVFNPDGSKYKILNNTGSFVALADGAIFYNGNGSWGTLVTTGAGYSMGSSGNWNITQSYPTTTQLQAYVPPTTQPLTAGQTASPPPPAYTSSITTAEQNRVNLAESRLQAITKNGIYIDQVGSNNNINVSQAGQYNLVDGIGSTSAPVQGNLNTITIRQGDPANPTGKNLIDLSVQGTGSNTLNLNQGRDTVGNSTGTDVGNHYQAVSVSGYSNQVTTNQQNTGGTVGHYLEANIVGNYNTVGIIQTDGTTQKQTFASVTGNNNVLNASQTGLGNHFLDVSLNGNGNSANVTQYGNTANAATINITNAGGPGSVNLTQTGGQVYNITTICVTAGGCAPITVRQGN